MAAVTAAGGVVNMDVAAAHRITETLGVPSDVALELLGSMRVGIADAVKKTRSTDG